MTGSQGERLLEALLFFLERPSVTGDEGRLCDDLEERLSRLPGWERHRVSNNLALRRSEPDATLPRVVFAGHLDTVPEPEGGIEVRVEGERVYGRGASDMKAGDAVMLALIEALPEEPRFEPLFVFYEREEGPYAQNGLETVFEASPWVLDAELAVVPEPTVNELQVGCVGTAQVEVTFRGRSGHAARPWEAENALSAAGSFLAELHARQAREVVVEGLPFYEVLTPTMAHGGETKNVVPDEFRVNVNHRFPPGMGREDVERRFEELLDGLNAGYAVVDFAPSGPVELENPLLRQLIGTGLGVRPKQAWTDVARFAGRGVAAVNFGPGLPSQAHQKGEYAELPLLTVCYERLRMFLAHD